MQTTRKKTPHARKISRIPAWRWSNVFLMQNENKLDDSVEAADIMGAATIHDSYDIPTTIFDSLSNGPLNRTSKTESTPLTTIHDEYLVICKFKVFVCHFFDNWTDISSL
jgi:hypothetical protein